MSAWPVRNSSRSTLSTTSRQRSGSRPLSTAPMPPGPISSSIGLRRDAWPSAGRARLQAPSHKKWQLQQRAARLGRSTRSRPGVGPGPRWPRARSASPGSARRSRGRLSASTAGNDRKGAPGRSASPQLGHVVGRGLFACPGSHRIRPPSQHPGKNESHQAHVAAEFSQIALRKLWKRVADSIMMCLMKGSDCS